MFYCKLPYFLASITIIYAKLKRKLK